MYIAEVFFLLGGSLSLHRQFVLRDETAWVGFQMGPYKQPIIWPRKITGQLDSRNDISESPEFLLDPTERPKIAIDSTCRT
jgi:hypothetical protein